MPEAPIPAALRRWSDDALMSQDRTGQAKAIGGAMALRIGTKAKRHPDELMRLHSSEVADISAAGQAAHQPARQAPRWR